VAWTNSKIFTAYIEDVLENTTAIDLNTDTFHAALFDNDVTPVQTAASASTAYNTGAWAISGNEVSDGTEWDAGGEPLTGTTSTLASNVFTFDATDTPSGGTSATLANVFGCLVYDFSLATPVDNQGISYHYFGGTNSVTDGQFTIVWNASGIFTLTL
jgi:hypothetical protein